MIAIDSSAVVATLLREKGYRRLEDAMSAASGIVIGAPTLFETSMVVTAVFDHRATGLLGRFLEEWGVAIAPFDARHWRVAAEAFARYGKGRSHPARLNYGDCMTYATARLAGRPLLFTGEDFGRTDLAVA